MFDKFVDVFLSSLRFMQFMCVIRAYERGVVLRFGKFHREIGPGRHWMWPFMIEEVWTTNVVPETMKIGPQSLTSRDGKSVVITTVITFHVFDVRKFLLEVEGANHAIEDAAYGSVARAVMVNDWTERVRNEMAAILTAEVAEQAAQYGVGINAVQIADFTESTSVRVMQQLSNRFEPLRQV